MHGNYLNSVCYLDTNIFVYMHDEKDVLKQGISNALYKSFLNNGRGRISVQVIAEWRNTMIKKFLHVVDDETRRTFIHLLEAWNPLVIKPALLLKADELGDRYNFSPYDAIHVQCALEQGCHYFLSEDMQDGLVVNKTLTLCNPYR